MPGKIDVAKARMDEIQAKILASGEQQELLPWFHFSSPCGWINDPNGFSFFNGEYHLFAQWHPFSTQWGPMHWCHAVSKNLVTWENMPPALAPDTDADSFACFSGTALESDGQLIVAYTGIANEGGKMASHQCIARYSGGHDSAGCFEKSGRNPVITMRDIPFAYDTNHFRDPKIWREDGKYFLVAAIKKTDGHGALVMFESPDLERWAFADIIAEETTPKSGMWECPDIFPLDGKDVLIVSQQEMREDKAGGFNKGNNTVYQLGEFNRETRRFTSAAPDFTMLDLGIDFYAAQTMRAPDGRRIMIAWMQNWDSYTTPQDYLWSGMMTFPRELSIQDRKLIQTPVRELREFCGAKETGKIRPAPAAFSTPTDTNCDTDCGENYGTKTFESRHCILDFEIAPNQNGWENESGEFHIQIGGETHNATLTFNANTMELSFNREKTVSGGGAMNKKTVGVRPGKNGALRLLCLVDTSSVEVFINGGEQVFTNTFFIPSNEKSIEVRSTLGNPVTYTFTKITRHKG